MKLVTLLLTALLCALAQSCSVTPSVPSASTSEHMKTITAGYTGLRGEKLRLRVAVAVFGLPSGRYVATAEFKSLEGEYSPITATKNFSSSDGSIEIRSRPLDSFKFPSRHSVMITVRPSGGGGLVATHTQEFVASGLTPELAQKLGIATKIES